jgi:hypothetical protein
MSAISLEHMIADRLGESPRTIHRLGFQPGTPRLYEPAELRLVVDCPFCGRAVPYPGLAGDGTRALAECLGERCDVYFDFAPGDVYVEPA